MRFEFFPLRFEFTARDAIYFPPDKASNMLRGGFGAMFRRIACAAECRGARECAVRDSCIYAELFEPASQGAGPSGFADRPRPFVFRARHLDGRSIQPGEPFYFDLNVFSLNRNALNYFFRSFAALAEEGFGPRRGKAELLGVRRLAAGALPEELVAAGRGAIEPAYLDLDPLRDAARRIRVEFLTPTELKHDGVIASRPEFPILFGRIRDRIGALLRFYGGGLLDIDYRESGARAAEVRMTRCDIRRREAARRSSRTGQTHSIGGFVGTAEYEGPLAEFLPYIEAARWTGVGRQAVWGKGEIAVYGAARDDWVIDV